MVRLWILQWITVNTKMFSFWSQLQFITAKKKLQWFIVWHSFATKWDKLCSWAQVIISSPVSLYLLGEVMQRSRHIVHTYSFEGGISFLLGRHSKTQSGLSYPSLNIKQFHWMSFYLCWSYDFDVFLVRSDWRFVLPFWLAGYFVQASQL